MSSKKTSKSIRSFFAISILLFAWSAPASADEEAGSNDDTPVVLEEIAGERNLTGARNWRPPDYSNQQGALGWSPNVFDVPKGLELNYRFWLDIYTKYTTDQGILHDGDYLDLVYEVLDFSHISSRTDIREAQKAAARTKAVKEGKKRIVNLLKKLNATKDPSTLSTEERRIWDFFEKIPAKKKFLDATSKNRLRFQLGQRDRIVQGIFFSGRYLEDFEKIFRESGLPVELTRLPFVESSFNVLARSKVGASGLWQIMRYTGRPYMMINNTIDKRNYPQDAAKLAAKLFRNNYNMLESWPLAVTGYNHGPAGVLKLTKLNRSRELGDLVQNIGMKKHLGFASRNFYASFLAALEAEKNAPQYYGPVFWSKPLNGVEITLNKPVRWKDIVRWFDGSDQIAQIYNPHITAASRKFGNLIPKNSVVAILRDKKDLVENEFSPPPSRLPSPKAVDGDLDPVESPAKAEGPHIYSVVRGDTLNSIARDFGIKVQELIDANKLDNPQELKVGQRLQIP